MHAAKVRAGTPESDGMAMGMTTGVGILGALAFGVVALSIACGPQSAPAGMAADVDASRKEDSATSFCGGYCDRLSSCDLAKNEQTCTDGCSTESAGTFPKLRGDVLTLINACLASKDCETVTSTNVVGACANEAAAQVVASETAYRFCEAYDTATTKCVKGESDEARCLTRAKLYNDAALTDATACTRRTCTDVDACVDAALGFVGTNGGGGDHGRGAGKVASGSRGGTCAAVADADTRCGQCVASACCKEFTSCVDDASCNALVGCLDTCGHADPACRTACSTAYTSGVTLYNVGATCSAAHCAASCD